MTREHGVRKVLAVAALAVAPFALTGAAEAAWTVDRAHTEINFSVNHFFTPVTGSFEEFEIDLAYDAENPAASRVKARIKTASISTGNAKRDEHLRSADFFDAGNHPWITFESTSIRTAGAGRLIARGPLTIRGESREVELPIAVLGTREIPEPMRAMLGGSRAVASFQAETAIDRGDFGVGAGSWAATLVVGGEVGIQILLEVHDRS